MRYIVFLLLYFSLFGDTSFITQMEYSSSLYKNPRGIGCQHCHGKNGEGKVVATYIHKKEKKTFAPPAINNMSFKDFYIALNERKKGMPRYFLTKDEIKALYYYLRKKQMIMKKNAK